MEITILAKSSSDPNFPYSVNFTFVDDLIRVHCNCPAGNREILCKHKIGFISNDNKMLHCPSDEKLLSQVQEILNNTSLPTEYSKFSKRIKEIEKTWDSLTVIVQTKKFPIANECNYGVDDLYQNDNHTRVTNSSGTGRSWYVFRSDHRKINQKQSTYHRIS